MSPRIAAALCVLASSLAAQGGPDPGFRVYLWRADERPITPAAAAALAAVGVTGIDAEGPEGVEAARATGLPFYVDHALPKGFLHIRPTDFQRQRDAFREHPDRTPLRRVPCLRDPAARREAAAALAKTLEALGPATPDFLSLGDECSATRGLTPMDWCLDEACLKALPAFLAGRHGGEAAARAAWGARWPKDGPPRPPSTSEARAAVFHGLGGRETAVAWNDFRAFTDAGFVDAVRALADAARATRPGLKVGLLGCVMPSAFGGYDWERLAREIDLVEVYDHGAARKLAGGLCDPRTRFVHTLTPNADAVELRQRVWHEFLAGDAGSILFWSKDWCVEGDPAKPSPLLKDLGPFFRELAGPSLAPWRSAYADPGDVAIFHSSDAVRANWLMETRDDGETWFNRLSSYEEEHGSDGRTREAWAALIADLGYVSTFVDSARLHDGSTGFRQYSALVLPRLSALSETDAFLLRTFASEKLLIADSRLGLFTDRFQDRVTPAFDALFGFSRPAAGLSAYVPSAAGAAGEPLAAIEPGLKATTGFAERRTSAGDAAIANRQEDVRTYYLNAEIDGYLEDRLRRPERAERLRRLLRPHLAGAISRPRVSFTVSPDSPPWPVALTLKRSGPEGSPWYAAFEINAATGARAIDWAPLKSRPVVKIRVRLLVQHRVTDLRTGIDIGDVVEFDLNVGLGDPRIVRLERR